MQFSAALKEITSDPPDMGLRNVAFDITPSRYRSDEYTLAIKGFLSPGWTGRLTAGLALHRIGIVTGEAEKITTYAWTSSFKLKSASYADDPLSIDYAALANQELPLERASTTLVLHQVNVERSSLYQGSLYVELRGKDRLGFLGDLLDFFSMRCLFPVKMAVETLGDTAVDKFWLKGVGGSVPSESLSLSLRESLKRLLVGNG